MMRRILRHFRRLARDRRATVAMTFALSSIPLVIGTGVAVDLSRAYVVETRLQNALDAAALAVGSSAGSQATLQTIAEKFFARNYPADKLGVPATPLLTVGSGTIHLSAQATMPTSFMAIVGKTSITVHGEVEALRKNTGVEVALVLDVTGSMAGTKIQNLRDAASDLVDELFGAETEPELLKVAVVPYSVAVNVGATVASQIVKSGYEGKFSTTNSYKSKGCVLARWDNGLDVTDTPFDTQAHRTLPYFYPSASSDNKWNDPDQSYDNSWGAPVTNYTQCNNMTGPNIGCPTPILPLTNRRDDIDDTIDNLVYWCRGGTLSNVGMAWGWRVLSPSEPFTEGSDYNDSQFNKAVVLMTDGVNQYYKNSGSTYKSDYGAYERLDNNRLGTTSTSTAVTVVNNRLLSVCSAMKDQGITVYTVTFQLNDNNTKNIYRNCASDPSKYFDSPDGDELRAHFRTIGAQLRSLRLTN